MNLDYPTSNSTTYTKINNPGRCLAMCCDWAKVSLTHGRSRKDLLNPGKWNAGQSAYVLSLRNENRFITNAGLQVEANASLPAHSGAIVANRLAVLKGTYIWSLTGPKAAHAMGYRRTDVSDVLGRTREVIEYFDPNDGLYVCDDIDDFKASLQKEIDTYYYHILGLLTVSRVRL